jgi:hypothetical protein
VALTPLGERALVVKHLAMWRDKPILSPSEKALLDTLIEQIRMGLHVEGPWDEVRDARTYGP